MDIEKYFADRQKQQTDAINKVLNNDHTGYEGPKVPHINPEYAESDTPENLLHRANGGYQGNDIKHLALPEDQVPTPLPTDKPYVHPQFKDYDHSLEQNRWKGDSSVQDASNCDRSQGDLDNPIRIDL